MVIQKTDSEIIVRLPSNVDTNGLQGLVDY
jgi:hypothetical protein